LIRGSIIAFLKEAGTVAFEKDRFMISVMMGSTESKHCLSKLVGIGSNSKDTYIKYIPLV
jgi:hypothetical protein